MGASHTLWEYAQYTSRVRKYAKEMPIAEAAWEDGQNEGLDELGISTKNSLST